MLSFNKDVFFLSFLCKDQNSIAKVQKFPFSESEYVLLRLSYCLQNTDLNEFQGSG